MPRLKGKIAIVTGASSGIGRATALLFAAEGAALVINARAAGPLDATLAEIAALGGKAVAVPGDVQHEPVAAGLVEAAVGTFGGLDIAFNNAGSLGELAPAVALSDAGWHEALAVNLTGAFFAARHQIPAMRRRGGGALVFTGTFVGHTVGMPGMAAYAASKAGLIGLVQVLAVEHGQDGIRANAILPGGTDTPMGRQVIQTPEQRRFVEGLHALKRLATPDEIARSVLHLASDEASFVTGTAFLVDGGVSINRT